MKTYTVYQQDIPVSKPLTFLEAQDKQKQLEPLFSNLWVDETEVADETDDTGNLTGTE